MADGVTEFDIARVLVEAHSGRGIDDEDLNAAVQVATERGLVEPGVVLTIEGVKKLARLRALFAPVEGD